MPQLVFTGLLSGAVPGVAIGYGSLSVTNSGVSLIDHSAGLRRDYDASGTGPASTGGISNTNTRINFTQDGRSYSLSQAAIDAAQLSANMGDSGGLQVFLSTQASQVSLASLVCASVAGTDYAFVAATNGAGIGVYEINPGAGGLVPVYEMPDTALTYGDGISAMTSVQIAGTTYLFVGSQSEHGITGYQVGAGGTLVDVESFGQQQSLPLQNVSVMDTAHISGRDFIVVGASGSSSLTVLEVDPGGGLTATSHIWDDLGTRFAAVSAIEVIEIADGRTLVLAAGGDSGLSVFALTPAGQLVHLESIEDTLLIGLDRVSSLAAIVQGDRLEIFATSQGDADVSQFTLDLTSLTDLRYQENGFRNGYAGDDFLVLGSGNGTLEGRYGDDLLVDGTGRDTLYGGGGADVFYLNGSDGQTDVIADFDVGTDVIDLSDWTMLYSADQLSVTTLTGGGLQLTFRGESFDLFQRSGGALSLSDFDDLDFQFLSNIDVVREALADPEPLPEPDPDPVDSDQIIRGTVNDDTLVGGTGDDIFYAGQGSDILVSGGGGDTFWGNLGIDVVSYADHTSNMIVDLNDAGANTGPAADDRFQSIEGIISGEGNDQLTGTDQSNWFHGGGGDDRIDGGLGNDTLYGGDGDDGLLGRDGDDLMYGGAGNDRLPGDLGDDEIYGEAGDDALGGDYGNDSLYGGEGNDRMGAGPGNDILYGGNGNDGLAAGSEADTLFGGAGNDRMAGSYGSDISFGGDGNDTMGGGYGHDYIDAGAGDDIVGAGHHNDTVYGGSGNDILNTATGTDTIYGGTGDDRINAGEENDTMTGGLGRDTFVFNQMISGEVDLVTDFEAGEDHLEIYWVPGANAAAKFSNLAPTQMGDDVYLTLRGHRIILEDVDLGDLSGSDFIFTGI